MNLLPIVSLLQEFNTLATKSQTAQATMIRLRLTPLICCTTVDGGNQIELGTGGKDCTRSLKSI